MSCFRVLLALGLVGALGCGRVESSPPPGANATDAGASSTLSATSSSSGALRASSTTVTVGSSSVQIPSLDAGSDAPLTSLPPGEPDASATGSLSMSTGTSSGVGSTGSSSGAGTDDLSLDGGTIECATADDCDALLGAGTPFCMGSCPSAPNGGCQHYICLAGVCQTTFCGTQPASFSGNECETPADCDALLGPTGGVCLGACSGGPNGGCGHYLCLAGICQTSYCIAQPSSFTGPECESPPDCEALLGPLPGICEGSCPDAPGGGCQHYVCLAGICQTTFCK